MKNKFLCLLFVLAMVFSMSACGSNDVDKDDNITNANLNVTGAAEANNGKDSVPASDANEEPTIEEQVLVDQDGLKITTLSLGEDSYSDPIVKLSIENTSDTNLTVSTTYTSVNGLMVDPIMSCDIAAGKKANTEITFAANTLEENGIEKIATIETSFYVVKTESYDTVFASDMITINTSISDGYVQTYDDSGEVIYDADGIKVVAKGYTSDAIFGPELLLYVVNDSKQAISLQTNNFSVNGTMVSPAFYGTVLAGKKGNVRISFYDLEDNGIETINDVEFTMNISDAFTYETIIDTDVISLTFGE